ncbi:MAG: hypothetical protein H6741_28420 [Alphaproteobacteria bacterium]|nr:hypothetical protein [Alphaproteobacteria bacterium]MCB9796642.1 hypothetical protein [Alphaproteobacteria bacterium]
MRLAAEPLQIKQGSLRIVWAPTELSWGTVPASNRFDRLEIGVMNGRKGFSSGSTRAYWHLGTFLLDRDAEFFDLTFGGGGVMIDLTDELSVRVGGDVRLRSVQTSVSDLFDDTPNDWGLLLGVPVGASYSTNALPGPLYAKADLVLRPAVGLIGPAPIVFDTRVNGEVGALVVDEPEAKVRLYLGYQARFDTLNNLPYGGMEHRIGLGGRAKF